MAESVLDDDPAAERYDSRAIVLLSGLEAVRRNPAMYIGSTDADGMHHLVDEVVDNAVDEVMAGHCTHVVVTVHADGSCTVADDGRGIPVDIVESVGRPAVEVALTTLNAGAKFGRSTYRAAAGLHGVGVSCVNALSDRLCVQVRRDGELFAQEFARGEPVTDLVTVGPADDTGTSVTFRPDPEVFGNGSFDVGVIELRLEELACLCPTARFTLHDEPAGSTLSFDGGAGVAGLLARRTEGVDLIHPDPIEITFADGDVTGDLAIRWTDGYAEQIWSFVNTVHTRRGGGHVDGLRVAVASEVRRQAVERHLLGRLGEEQITSVDVLEGVTAVVALSLPEPSYDSQTKMRLRDPRVEAIVAAATHAGLADAFERTPDLAEAVVLRALQAARGRLAARAASRPVRVRSSPVAVDYDTYRRQFGIRSSDWHDSCTWLTDEELLGAHADLCAVAPDGRMLDVCCGSGVVGSAFADRVGDKVGLDITPEMVQLAGERLDIVHKGNVYDLPFEDESFDLVVNREVLHLLPNPERPISEIARVLRPGGQFIVGQILPYSDVDAYWMFRIFKKKQPLLTHMFLEQDFRDLLLGGGFVDLTMTELFVWESIERWIDTHETTPAHRQEIYRLFYDAPDDIRAVHPFEVGADGSVRDQWRWCVYSVRKPKPPAGRQ